MGLVVGLKHADACDVTARLVSLRFLIEAKKTKQVHTVCPSKSAKQAEKGSDNHEPRLQSSIGELVDSFAALFVVDRRLRVFVTRSRRLVGFAHFPKVAAFQQGNRWDIERTRCRGGMCEVSVKTRAK